MRIALSEEAIAMIWDDYLRSFGIDAYLEARYAPPQTVSVTEYEAEALKAA